MFAMQTAMWSKLISAMAVPQQRELVKKQCALENLTRLVEEVSELDIDVTLLVLVGKQDIGLVGLGN
jgi:hypothetical protein